MYSTSLFSQPYSNRTIKLNFNDNGHEYLIHDFISEEINKYYLQERVNMETQIHDEIDSRDRVEDVSVDMPDNISAINFSADTYGNGKIEIRMNNIQVDFTYITCTYHTTFDIILTGNINKIPNTNKIQLSITNLNAQDDNFKVNGSEPISGWLWWLDWLCEYGVVGVYIVHNYDFAENFKQIVYNKTFDIYDLDRMPEESLNPSQIEEVVNSFPIQLTLSGDVNSDLVISLKFLRGTIDNPYVFDGISPAQVTDPTFEHLGFNLSRGSLYKAFESYNPINRPFTSSGESGNTAQRDFIIQNMKNYLGRTVSFYFHWSDIAIDQNGSTLLVNGNYDPANLTPEPGGPLDSEIAELYANGQWQKSTDILNSLHQNEFDVVATVGTGGILKEGIISGPMAPDRTLRGMNEGYFYVDKNTYLYYLKIFAHAIVRKYKDQIGVWLIQPELNAAKFASWIGFGGKRGNCWDEQGKTNDYFQWQVWRTWVEAVRQEDPTAKVSTALHMLNMQYGLETFGLDCDIISVNIYPNELFATPVMGFAVGELVWGVRRALKGMGWEHKPVWITETNYPGVINSYDEEPPAGTTLENNLSWYSYGRQGKYMQDAIESAAENGAKGFFWWNFLDSDSAYHSFFPWTGYGSLIIGNSNPPQFKLPAVTAFQSKSSVKHFGKSSVTLTNKTVSNPNINMGGNIGIYAQRDNLTSGTFVYVNRNRSHITQTNNQVISSQKHLSWGDQNPSPIQFRLKENYLPSALSELRNAWFAATSPVTINTACLDGGTVSTSILNYQDPWWVDGNGNQPNTSRTVSLSPTFIDYIFTDRPTIDGQPYYTLAAPTTQTITLNGQPTLGVFHNWSYTNATAQNAFSTTSGFVFNTGATVTAIYKGHLLTNSTAALSSNSQRKIIQDGNYDNLHLVYESGGNIYSTYSSDNGETWAPELRVNSTLGGCFSPSITYSQNRTQVTTAWLQDIGGSRYAVIASCYGSGDNWSQIQSIAAPNAQQLQISSMTNGGLSDLLVWRDGTSQLKGTIRTSGQNYFGTVYSLLFRDYNYISGFSLGAFGRSDRWDLVWIENGNLQYSSVYIYAPLSQPRLDYHLSPALVAAASDWTHLNPSIVKTGNNLTVAWETYNDEIVRRNIKVAQITPNTPPSYPTIGTATTFSNVGTSSHYYTPSISSHSNNNLSLSWRKSPTAILCAKRVNGSWQTVTTLGLGYDPSASERYTNTQNSSIHFRRGTSLPYVLSNTNVTTSGGGELEKIGNDGGSMFAGEGREIFLRSANGTSSFALVNATTAGNPIIFEDVDDTKHISAMNDIRIALRSKPFIATGESSVELDYNSQGELPPLRKVRVLLEEVSDKGISIRPLGIVGEFEGSKRSNETITFSIPKSENLVRIIIDPVMRDDSMHIEVSKWYTVDASNLSLEKSGKEPMQARIVAPAVLDLLQNYPNPFNPVTTIEFTVPKDGNAKLSVYNSLGQMVAMLYDGFAQVGYVQKATFDGSQLSSGVYYSRLEYDGKTIMKKLMLLK